MKRILLVLALGAVTWSSSRANDLYLITVESNISDVLEILQGYPGMYWGRTANRAFLDGDAAAIDWLRQRNIPYRAAAFHLERSSLFLIVDNHIIIDEASVIDSGPGYIISTTRPAGGEFGRRLHRRAIPASNRSDDYDGIQVFDENVDYLISLVNGDTIMASLSRLSGESTIEIDGRTDTIHTRYTPADDNRLAAQYIKEVLESYGYQTEYHAFYGGQLRNVAAYNSSLAWAVSEDSDVIGTTDGGVTWRSLPDNTTAALWGVENIGPDTVWVAGDRGTILLSSDGGGTFISRSPGLLNFLFGLDFINNSEGWIAADLSIVLHTSDAGMNWDFQAPPVSARLYDVDFIDSQYGWAVGRNGTIVHTTNGGTNWSQQTSNTGERLYGVDFTSRNNGWVVGWGGVVRHTIDGGTNWATADVGSNIEKYQVDFTDSLHGCIVGWAGEIFVTTDGGVNWTQSVSGVGNDLYGVEFINNSTGYAVGEGAVLRTTDGGVSWANQTSGVQSGSPNVVATRTGAVMPGQQVIICGHFDDTSEQPFTSAPGSDDNGSGTAAVIEAARVFAGLPFERTLKFCLWTGEEQGLLGSAAYASDAFARGDTIVGVLNFDMIAWDGNADGSIELHCGTMTSSQQIGHLFEDVVTDYSIDLTPEFLTWNSTDRSDHASFWDHNYPAILGIEDFSSDFNPFYHTTSDNMSHVNAGLFLEFTKAAIGSAATLAILDTTLVGVEDEGPLPDAFALRQNYPNPFNPATTLAFSLPSSGHARLVVYDLLGQAVRIIVDGDLPAGQHRAHWDGKTSAAQPAASGIYFARLESGDQIATIRMSLVK
jgi:photosystem II stability/assembly factor-like uncharacterized protein